MEGSCPCSEERRGPDGATGESLVMLCIDTQHLQRYWSNHRHGNSIQGPDPMRGMAHRVSVQ